MPERWRSPPAASLEELPPDYHARIERVEDEHWWHRGMRRSTAALLGERLWRPNQRVLDAGCGTGGFLRWLIDHGTFASAAGLDAVPQAIERARRRLPEADLKVGLLPALPFSDASFDLVVCNDVLQHLTADAARSTLSAFRRVLHEDGAVVVRTSAAQDSAGTRWKRSADGRGALRRELESVGFSCRRITHVNMAPSLLADVRRRSPTELVARHGHGIPDPARAWQQWLGQSWLTLEAITLEHTRIDLPYGHTMLALAVPT